MNLNGQILLSVCPRLIGQIYRVNSKRLLIDAPYFIDCYLDLIIYPDGNIIVDDRDELDAALSEGDITEEQYNRALQTADKLQNGLLKNYGEYCTFIRKMLGKGTL